jgi:peptidylprolyl isomerase
MSKVESGNTVNVHYTGTFDDGTKFDSSHDRGETLSFQVGSGQVVPGFESALVGMSTGETKTVHLTPDQAYGEPVQEAVQEFGKDMFPPEMTLTEGVTIMGQNELGQQMMGKVVGLTDTTATIDFNHPLAGKNLNFEIELVSIG